MGAWLVDLIVLLQLHLLIGFGLRVVSSEIYAVAFVLICICCYIAELFSKQEARERQERAEAQRQVVAQQSLDSEAARIREEQEALRQKELAQASKQLEQLAASKRPDTFKRLFTEEFPDFPEAITYAKSEELLRRYQVLLGTDLVVETQTSYTGREETIANDKQVQAWLANTLAPVVSPVFGAYAATHPAEFLISFDRAAKPSMAVDSYLSSFQPVGSTNGRRVATGFSAGLG